jgi:hypothetical protein
MAKSSPPAHEFRTEADALAGPSKPRREHPPRTAAVPDGQAANYAGASGPGARLSFQPAPHPVTTGPEHHGLQSFRSRAPGARPFSAIAQRNGPGAVHQFSLDPTSEQRLEDLQRESVGFLQRINVPVRDLTGKVIGLARPT